MKSAEALFEAELKKRKADFSPLEKSLYSVTVGRKTYTVCVDNLERDFRRDRDPAAVTKFVDQILSPFALPPWERAQNLVFIAAETSDLRFDAAIHDKVTDSVSRVLTLTDSDESKISYLTPAMLAEWGQSKDAVETAALKNLDGLLVGKELEVEKRAEMTFGMLPVNSVFKASLIFAPAFKAFVSPTLGWPVLAVIPCRDFIYVMPESMRASIGRLGPVVIREYTKSGYPITTEVLSLSDKGMEAIGEFRTAKRNRGNDDA